jgi:hypothetical protein
MTPYTSFLVQEDSQVFSERGRRETAEREYWGMVQAPPAAPTGKLAVDEAEEKKRLERSNTATEATGGAVKVVGDKVFLLREGTWVDTTFDAEHMTPLKVAFMSEDYFALLRARPEWAAYFAVGERVLVVLEDTDGRGTTVYQVVGEGEGEPIDVPVIEATPTPRSTPTAAKPQATATAHNGSGAGNPAVQHSPRTDPKTCSGAATTLLIAILAALLFARRH